jgi:hypothetical protein
MATPFEATEREPHCGRQQNEDIPSFGLLHYEPENLRNHPPTTIVTRSAGTARVSENQ